MTNLINENLIDIEERAIQFFLQFTNFDVNSKGYGLTVDHSQNKNRASIAATGFMLSALIIAVENKTLDEEDAIFKVKKTLETLLSLEHFNGFFAHFYNMTTSEKINTSEYSTIDTAICLSGVLACETYFKSEEITELSLLIANRINWESFVEYIGGKTILRMAYNPNNNGDYVVDKPGFISSWNMVAEQLLIYPIIAGSINNRKVSNELYKGFDRTIGSIGNEEFLYSPHNTLFVYHLPLCFLDLRGYLDEENVDWVLNAKTATKSHQLSSVKSKDIYPTFSKYTFGMNASDTDGGYRVFGALPNIEDKLDTDGTVAPYSVVCSLPYLNKDASKGIEKMKTIKELYQEYGFLDAYKISEDKVWISNKYIAIDKGLELLSVNQLTSNIVRRSFMKHKIIQNGLKNICIKKRD